MDSMNRYTFAPAFWLPGPHFQTIWASKFRRLPSPKMEKERIEQDRLEKERLEQERLEKDLREMKYIHGKNTPIMSPAERRASEQNIANKEHELDRINAGKAATQRFREKEYDRFKRPKTSDTTISRRQRQRDKDQKQYDHFKKELDKIAPALEA